MVYLNVNLFHTQNIEKYHDMVANIQKYSTIQKLLQYITVQFSTQFAMGRYWAVLDMKVLAKYKFIWNHFWSRRI